MDACKLIFSNKHGHNFVNEVAYLSIQVTNILPNAKIENKNKCRLLEVITGQVRGRGCGCWRYKSDLCDRGCFHTIGGHGGGGRGDNLGHPYNTWNGVDI